MSKSTNNACVENRHCIDGEKGENEQGTAAMGATRAQGEIYGHITPCEKLPAIAVLAFCFSVRRNSRRRLTGNE